MRLFAVPPVRNPGKLKFRKKVPSMHPILLYHSRTGFTRQYAVWLSEDLHCSALPYRERKHIDLSQYDTLIFGSWLRAGRIMGLQWLKKHLAKGGTAVLFVTGAAPHSPDQMEAIRKNFTAREWERLQAFYLPGGLNYDAMAPVDRAMMTAYRTMVKAKEGAGSETYQRISSSYTMADRAFIQPVVEAVKNS